MRIIITLAQAPLIQ